MNLRNVPAIICCFILASAVLLPTARADEWNQMTKLEFSQPVEIPGGVLPAGAYWFVLQDNQGNRDVVQIFSADWQKIDATLLAVPASRQRSTNDTEIEFAERPHQKPEALLKWYYPGSLMGHEFLYSARHEREFARDAKQEKVADPLNVASDSFSTRR
jgi:hypothetical protein